VGATVAPSPPGDRLAGGASPPRFGTDKPLEVLDSRPSGSRHATGGRDLSESQPGAPAPVDPSRPASAASGEASRPAPRPVCPFFRLEAGGLLVEPGTVPGDDHRCVAIAGPRVVSQQQQELVCLRPAHVDCPRYRRATAQPAPPSRGPLRRPAIPRATAAAVAILALSAGISFGFVIQRGGIDLPPSPSTPAESGAAVIATASPPAPGVGTPSATPSGAEPSVPPSGAPSAEPTPPPTPRPTVAPRPSPAPAATPQPSASGGVPSASRLAVLTACPGQAGCYVYKVRQGDNLFSIAKWFGVPLATVYAWNPSVKTQGIHPGDSLKIPTPTR